LVPRVLLELQGQLVRRVLLEPREQPGQPGLRGHWDFLELLVILEQLGREEQPGVLEEPVQQEFEDQPDQQGVLEEPAQLEPEALLDQRDPQDLLVQQEL
jgi:hypothetical protein